MTRSLLYTIAIATVLGFVATGCSTKAETSETENQTPMTSATTDGTQKATITIDGGKYTPNVITVEHGKPVELTFQGGQELGCGGTIVFKSLNQSKEVESGKSVTFAFTPNKAGEIPFTCSMDMYDGKVVVK
jgi:plastocyanin domain-containing protein